MDENHTGVTVYFAGFELGSSEEQFRQLFSQFGYIEKIFLHKTKNYGMVEFNNISSCREAIEALHQTPPLNLQVNMAKNQITSNGNASAFSTARRSQNYNKFNQSYNKQPQQQHENTIDNSVIYEECDYYLDENNEFVTVFTDPITNEIYVPLRYAPTLKRVTRKVPKRISTFDDERSSTKSDHSDRTSWKQTKRTDFKTKYTNARKVEETASFNNHNDSNSFENRDQNNQSRNEENRSPNVPNRAGPRFPKSVARTQKRDDDNGDWSSCATNKIDKVETVPVVATTSKSNVVKPVQPVSTKAETVPVVASTSKSNLVKPVQPISTKAETVPAVASTSKMNVVKPVQHVSTKTIDKSVLKTLELSNNQFTEVHVENVIDAATGWVTLTSKVEEFQKFTIDVYGIVDTAARCNPEVGKLVLALYENIWFRATILSISPEITVRYIDYGNEEVITKEDIKELPSEFAKIPAYAFCIKLADGAPCKMANDITIKVKPIKKENNLTVVHVENGVYEIEQVQDNIVNVPKRKEKENKHVLDIVHKLLISQTDIENNKGFLELTIGLSKTKFIAAFMPLHLTEAAAILQKINPPKDSSFKPAVGEIVCAENEEGWQRVYLLEIINTTKYKVAFIDYGVISEVSEVRSLPNEFINIPIFSCVCNAVNGDDLTQVKEPIDFEVTDVSENNITCAFRINEKEVNVVCSPWDPRDRQSLPESQTVNKPQFTVSDKNDPLEEIILKNGDDVRLELESDGYLYVRNKQASIIKNKIDKSMAIFGPNAATISGKPHVGQLVTAEFETEFCRAIIKSINNNDVTIEYIDYGNEETVPFFSLKVLNDEMMKEPKSIIKIRLRNFINKPFSAKDLVYLENVSVKKIILKATFDQSPENGYDLKLPNGLSVSDELEKLNRNIPKAKSQEIPKSSPPRPPVEKENEFYKTIKVPCATDAIIYMSELPLVDIPLGKTEVIFQEFSDIDNNILCVCVNDPKILHTVHVEMQNQMSKYVANMVPNASHEPEMEECVLVQSEGKWYRGACTSPPENNEYTIFLVDYGSCNQFLTKNIRRMPKEFAQEKALCNFAKLEGLPNNPSPSLRNRLKTLFERNNSYPVNVIEKIDADECYIIEFPTIIQVLKEEKLF